MTKISALSDIGTSVASNDTFVLVDVSDPTTPNKKIQQQNLFLIPDGSAGTPGLRFLSDTNVGLFRPTTDTLAIATGGSERLRIDSSGRLGLGTSSPSYLLHLNGSSTVEGRAVTSGSSSVSQFTAQNSTGATISLAATGSGYTPYGAIGVGNAYVYTNSDLAIATDGANVIKFATGANVPERMRIDASGRVGIGTTDIPSDTNLAVLGNFQSGFYRNVTSGGRGYFINIGAKTSTGFADGAYIFGAVESGDSTGYLTFGTRTSGSVTEKARIDSSGRLLVGTSTNVDGIAGNLQVNGGSTVINTFIGNSAAYRLSFVKSRNGTFNGKTIVQSGDDLGLISFYGDDGVDYTSEAARITAQVDGTPGSDDMPGRLVFSTTADGASSPTERMRITAAGRMLLNTTSESTPANGQLSIDAAMNNNNGIVIQNTDTQGAGQFFAIFYNSAGNTAGSISHSGTTAVAFNTSSDYRLKENVVPLTGAADRVNQLQVHRFNFIADPSKTVDGFIAHEAQAVVPECVTGEKDAVDDDGNPVYQGIDQSKLVPLLTAALQEALAEIESLKARLDTAGI